MWGESRKNIHVMGEPYVRREKLKDEHLGKGEAGVGGGGCRMTSSCHQLGCVGVWKSLKKRRKIKKKGGTCENRVHPSKTWQKHLWGREHHSERIRVWGRRFGHDCEISEDLGV